MPKGTGPGTVGSIAEFREFMLKLDDGTFLRTIVQVDKDGNVVGSGGNPLSVIQRPIVSSVNNSTATPLLASGSFIGASDNILSYQQINLTLFGRPNKAVSGDANDALGSLFFEFSPDGTNWDISVPIVVRTLGVFIPYPLINVGAFYRIRYLNDGGASAITILGTGETPGVARNQTVFRLNSYLLPLATKDLARTLDQSLSGSDPVQVVRAVSTGKDTNGVFVNAPGAGVNSANSSVTPLAGGATFTPSAWMDLSGYAGASVAVNTDKNGSLLVDFSEDTTTVDYTNTIPISGGTPFFTGLTPLTRYMRIRYTNGAAAQSTFRLQTVVKLTSLASTPDQISTATLNALNQSVAVNTTQGFAAIAAYVASASTFVGTLAFETTLDGVNWTSRVIRRAGLDNFFATQISGTPALPLDATKDYRGNAAGFTAFRVRVSAYTSGSCVVTVEASVGAGPIETIAPITIAPTTVPLITVTTLGSGASQVDTALLNRKSVEVHYRANNGNNTRCWVGFSAGVGASSGRQLELGESIIWDVSEATPIFVVASSAGQTVECTEVGS